MLFGEIQSFLKRGKGGGSDLKTACLSSATILGRRFPSVFVGHGFGLFDDKKGKGASIFYEFD